MSATANEIERSNLVGVGMVIAAAIVAGDNDVLAEEILGAAGLETVAKMRAAGCDDYDIDKLRPLVREMSRRRRWAKRRAAFNRAPTEPEDGPEVGR